MKNLIFLLLCVLLNPLIFAEKTSYTVQYPNQDQWTVTIESGISPSRNSIPTGSEYETWKGIGQGHDQFWSQIYFTPQSQPISLWESYSTEHSIWSAQWDFKHGAQLIFQNPLYGLQNENWHLKSFFTEKMLFHLIPHLAKNQKEKLKIQLFQEKTYLGNHLVSEFATIEKTSKTLKLKAMREINSRAWEVKINNGQRSVFWISEEGSFKTIRAVLSDGSTWTLSGLEP